MIDKRKFQPNDMFSVIKIASETLTENYNPSLFNYFYETFPQGFIIAEKHHKIIGFIVGIPLTLRKAKILMISISEKQRRQNIGSELLNKFIQEIILQEINQIELEVKTDNTNAINFYKNHGFKITEKICNFYQNGEDAYTMKKTI